MRYIVCGFLGVILFISGIVIGVWSNLSIFCPQVFGSARVDNALVVNYTRSPFTAMFAKRDLTLGLNKEAWVDMCRIEVEEAKDKITNNRGSGFHKATRRIW